MRIVEHDRFINLGFHIKKRFIDLIVGGGIGVLIIGIGYLVLIMFNQIKFIEFNKEPRQIVYLILLFLIVAVSEEVLLRGYVLRNLMISFNKYFALILSSIIFSMMHGFNPNIHLFGFIDLFLAGVLLGIAYIHTKNLWFPIALHFSWNLSQAFLGFNVSGLTQYSLVEISIMNNNKMNVGDFGFEGSIPSMIFQVIFIIGIEYFYLRKANKVLGQKI